MKGAIIKVLQKLVGSEIQFEIDHSKTLLGHG